MAYLPLFPLNLVAYPGERLNLHIFEPRYRQLVGECVADGTTFGIPTYLNGALLGCGTEMEVVEVVTRHDNGNLDIKTRGLRVFRLTSFDNPAPGKLYAGGKVSRWPEPEEHPYVMPELVALVQRLYRVFDAELKAHPNRSQPYSYQIGHGVGLPTEAEYQLLTMEEEAERQDFLYEYLQTVMPVVENMERTKERIRMNGHFREFGELNF
jgi:Lon protease-like protein